MTHALKKRHCSYEYKINQIKPVERATLRRSLSYGPLDSDYLMLLSPASSSESICEAQLLLGRSNSRKDNNPCETAVFSGIEFICPNALFALSPHILSVLIAGTISAYSYIVLNESCKGCSDLILFAQYVFCILEGVASGSAQKYVGSRNIPLYYHALFVSLFGVGNFLYTASLQLGLPMPAHIVIKNSGISFTMLLGCLILKKEYSLGQLAGVAVITIGILLTTFSTKVVGQTRDFGATVSLGPTTYLLPAILLVCGVICQSLLNVSQEIAFGTYGKHFQEALFLQHFMGLPLFAIKRYGIVMTATLLSSRQWLMLLVNISTTYIMKLSCLKLTADVGSMICILTVTVVRFLSLIISASIVMPHKLSIGMFVGGMMVLGGTFQYLLNSQQAPNSSAKEKKE